MADLPNFDRDASPPAKRSWLPAFLVAQALVAAIGIGMCFHARGKPLMWLLLAGALPALRFAADAPFRRKSWQRLRDLWASLDVPTTSFRRRGMAAWCFVILPAALLFLTTQRRGVTGDTWPVLPTACSIVREGNGELSEYLGMAPNVYGLAESGGLPYCVKDSGHGVYSSYPSGMVFFALPVAAVARLAGANFARHEVHTRLEKWTAIWLAAMNLGLFFLLSLRLAAPSPAWVVTFLLAGGSVFFSTISQALWQHGGVIFWTLSVLLVEFETAKRPSLVVSLLQGFALGMMIPCRLTSVLFVVPFGVWVLVRSPKRACVITAVALVVFAPWAVFHYQTYGTPIGPSSGQMDAASWNTDISGSMLGLLFSPARGLFVYQPWLLLPLFCLIPVFRRGMQAARPSEGNPVGWSWLCLVVIVLQVTLVSAWGCWWGGNCWGSRLLAEVVPLAALLCLAPVALLLRSFSGRTVLASLAAVAFFLHAAGVYDPPAWEKRVEILRHPEMVWSWSQAPFVMAMRK